MNFSLNIENSINWWAKYLTSLINKNWIVVEEFGKWSSHWVSTGRTTAYVGSTLKTFGKAHYTKEIENKVIDGLLSIQHWNGWRWFNNETPADSDSTARAIECLIKHNKIEDYKDNIMNAIKFLLIHQNKNQESFWYWGFTTYNKEIANILEKEYGNIDGWSASHLCVSSTINKVLWSPEIKAIYETEKIRKNVLNFIQRYQKKYWNYTYRWRTNLYSMYENKSNGIEEINQNQLSDPIELGLYLLIKSSYKQIDMRAIERLINLQQNDGWFTPSYQLTIPRPDTTINKLIPWYETKKLADTSRTLSTSAAIAWLSKQYEIM